MIIGVANTGGVLKPNWIPSLVEALEAGLDIVSGMHGKLAASRELKAAADRLGRRLIDIRQPPAGIPVATGRKRTGKRLLAVGTDCALGKKYTALAIARAMRRRGVDADFRATGQTGIMIAGSGMPMDAVVSDFVAGAAEMLSPDAAPDHWDVIEGQGSLFHPAYAGVSLGLLHGSQPDVIVLCHEPGRDHLLGYPDYPTPSLADAIALHLQDGLADESEDPLRGHQFQHRRPVRRRRGQASSTAHRKRSACRSRIRSAAARPSSDSSRPASPELSGR